jgi:hypothetical protein
MGWVSPPDAREAPVISKINSPVDLPPTATRRLCLDVALAEFLNQLTLGALLCRHSINSTQPAKEERKRDDMPFSSNP